MTTTPEHQPRLQLMAHNGHAVKGASRPAGRLTDAQGNDELIEMVNGLHDRLSRQSDLRVDLAGFAAQLERRRAVLFEQPAVKEPATPTDETEVGITDEVNAYIRDQRQFGRLNSKASVDSYRRVLGIHGEDVGGQCAGETDREDVKRTLRRWEGKNNTQYHAHSTLISFYDWAMQEGIRADNPARQVRRNKLRQPSVYRLTREEVIRMMGACETPRERRLVYIGFLTGARVGELAAFQVRHFQREGWVWFSEDISKGKKERWVPVLPELEPIVAEIVGGSQGDAFVIPTQQRSRGKQPPQPGSRVALGRMIKAVGRRAGIVANIHPHLLRHAFGDHVAKYGGLQVAQALMGHESVQTTARVYVGKPDLDELAAGIHGFRYRPLDADGTQSERDEVVPDER
jgi:integrase